jgi:acyl-CoA synthetase (AMP-forming)/AMP-acid ligase II
MSSLSSLLAVGRPDAPAIGAPGRPWLTYEALRAQTAETIRTLNALGIGRGDRVAIVMPNGPEMAAGFLGVASAAGAAPLNPAYRAEEFAFYLEDLKPKALVVRAGDDTPALAVAADLGIPVVRLTPREGEEAGRYALSTDAVRETRPAERAGPAEGDDVALVLHTSGTTARPKIVPLTNANLAASARHIGAALALTPDDVCLNVMPLFHIHGLVAAILSSLGAGAAVSCTPGFNALKMFGWLEEVGPTWYTAVPTMHQAILARAGRQAERSGAGRLRFVRSSSASLPPQVMAELEAAFGCPVIESYGMTEAAHQMASNPLPPRPRKPGSVGIAAGPRSASWTRRAAFSRGARPARW